MNTFIVNRPTPGGAATKDQIIDNKIPVYDSKAAAEADIANIVDDGIVFTKDTGATEKVVDVVQDGNMNPVTSNAVYDYVNGMNLIAINAVNSETSLDTLTRIAHLITQNCTLTGHTYIGIIILAGYDYGAINVANMLDYVRGTVVMGDYMYKCTGTISNPTITRVI